MNDEQLLIGELSRRAGVSIRTVRYYISEGLLPSPQIRGRYTLYNEDHLYRLRLIQRLKDAHLPLKEIREQVNNLTTQKIKELLDRVGKEQDLVGKVVPPSAPAPTFSTRSEDSSGAVDYISRILEAHTPNRATWAPPYRTAAPTVPDKLPISPALVLEENITYEAQETTWKRIELAPGVELLIRQPLPEKYAAGVQELIELAKKLF